MNGPIPDQTTLSIKMDKPSRRIWLLNLVLVGALYCTIGIGFSAFAARSTSHRTVVAWNVASFVVSAIVFAIHIGYEHLGLGNQPLMVALHTSLAVALGAFLLAVAANINSFRVTSSHHRLLAIALVIWPLMTGIPAFVVALIVAAGLRLFGRIAKE